LTLECTQERLEQKERAGEKMKEKEYVIKLISPRKRLKGQIPKLYMGTQEEIGEVLGGCVKIGVIDTAHRLLIREWEEVEIIDIEEIIEQTKDIERTAGVEVVVETKREKIKIVYTDIRIKVIYAKSKKDSNINNKVYYYRGYKIENIENIGLKIYDGYIPLDKNNARNTIDIKKHNKRKLIKRGVKYIHNEIKGKIAYLETVRGTKKDLFKLKKEKVNLKHFIEELIKEEKNK
jgi:hypothetical protein